MVSGIGKYVQILIILKAHMGMVEYGDQTVVPTIITCWHTTAAAILVLLQVADITTSEIT